MKVLGMTVIAKARVLEASKGGALVQLLGAKGKMSGEKKRVGVKEGLRLRKGDTVVVSFGIALEKVR